MSSVQKAHRIGAVILAAGASRRMGQNKSLLSIDGRPMLARVWQTLRTASERIVVVTGHDAGRVRSAIANAAPDVQFVHNPEYEAGEMLSSIKVGVEAIRGVDAFFVALGDQPRVREATLRQLVDSWQSTRARVVRPTYRGKHGHPVLLDASCIELILALPPAATLNEFVRADTTQTVDVAVRDQATIEDIDTPADYAAAKTRRGGRTNQWENRHVHAK
ncbi:MAG: nucleotidyltransferase family protein [Tepidisphaeraceae bacterium]